MTNEEMILKSVQAHLTPAQRHEIAAAAYTPEQIAHAVEHIPDGLDELAAAQIHTFGFWKQNGKSVKRGEKALFTCPLWKYTDKPSKAQRDAAEAAGEEAKAHPHYYPTTSYMFSCLQVESSKPAPQARFKSTAEIIAYNKQLAAERKAAKEAAAKAAAAKAAAEAARPAPIVVEEHHELPELVHVEPLPTKPAPKKSRTTKSPPPSAVDMEELEPVFEKWYSNFYRTHDDNDSKEYREAVKTFDQKSKNDPEFSSIVQQFTNHRCDFISSDREAAAFVMALDELSHKRNAPEMVPSVQQLDFESIAANLLA